MRPATRNRRDLNALCPYCGCGPFGPAPIASAPAPKGAIPTPRITSAEYDRADIRARCSFWAPVESLPANGNAIDARRRSRLCGDTHPNNASGWPSNGSRSCSANPDNGISSTEPAEYVLTGSRRGSSPNTEDVLPGSLRSCAVRWSGVTRPATTPARTSAETSPFTYGERAGWA